MIRNILVIARSGVVLFSKEFQGSLKQPRLVGSLLTALVEFSLLSTGQQVNYIEMSQTSVAIARSETFRIQCAVVLEPKGLELKYVKALGKLLCEAVIGAFAKKYADTTGSFKTNLGIYLGFHESLRSVVWECVSMIVYRVHTTPGVRRCLLFYGEGRDRVLTHHADLDQTEARLHLEDMLAQTAHLSLNESCASISVDLIDPSCRIFICRLFGSSILLSVIDLESSDKVTALREIKASSKILDQVLMIHELWDAGEKI